MARIYSSVVLSALLSISSTVAADDPVYFIEEDGVVVIEMESLAAEGDWAYEANIENYSGDGYFVWRGSDNFKASSAENGDPIEFNIRIATPGNYQFRWRSYITLGESSTEHNDSWVELPSGEDIEGELALDGWTKAYMNRYQEWSWDAKTTDHVGNPIRQYFEAGDHVIRVSGRSNGHAIDKIVLYKYDEVSYSNNKFTNFNPSDTTTALPTVDDPDVTEEEPIDEETTEEPVEETPTEEPTDETTEEPPESLPALQSDHEHPGNECIDGTVSLTATYATSLLSDGSMEKDSLILGEDADTAYVSFDLSAVPLDASNTALLFYPISSEESSTLTVYAGSHSDWASVDDADALPTATVSLGSDTFNLSRTGFQRLDLDGSLLTRDMQTLLLTIDTQNGSTTLGEPGTEFDPRLEVSGDDNFCQQYEDAVAQAEADKAAAEQAAIEAAEQAAAEQAAAEQEAAEQEAAEAAQEEASDLESVIENVTPETGESSGGDSDDSELAALNHWLLVLLMLTGVTRLYATTRKGQ